MQLWSVLFIVGGLEQFTEWCSEAIAGVANIGGILGRISVLPILRFAIEQHPN